MRHDTLLRVLIGGLVAFALVASVAVWLRSEPGGLPATSTRADGPRVTRTGEGPADADRERASAADAGSRQDGFPPSASSPASPAADGQPRPADAPAGTPAGDDPADDEDATPTSVWPATAAGIDGAVKEKLPDVLRCYQAWLEADPKLEGKIVVGFRVAESAEEAGVARAEVTAVESNTIDNALFRGCVGNVMGDLRFDPPEGGELTVNYPFRFSPG